MESEEKAIAEPSAAAPTAQTCGPLPYADASTPRPIGPARFDYTVLALASLQAGLTLFYTLRSSSSGYYESDAARWITRAAWRLMDLEFLAASLFVISTLAFIGAARPAHGRRGWYRAALAALAIEALLWCAAGGALYDADFNFRWVSTYSGKPQPQHWDSFALDPSWWRGGPVMMLICNPACLILMVRWPLGRALATGEPRLPAGA